METVHSNLKYQGYGVLTPWSNQVTVVEVIFSINVDTSTFHGVRTKNLDMSRDWLDSESLLWVVEEGRGLRLWQGFEQSPYLMNGDGQYEIDFVVGGYQSSAGSNYFGVKWLGYPCPTWVSEDELTSHEKQGQRSGTAGLTVKQWRIHCNCMS